MRLARMGSAFPTRLSFLPTLLRRLSRERCAVRRTLWEIDQTGFGRAVYTLRLGGADYSLVAFSTPLPPEKRTDRVIAEEWDATFVLYDGVPDEAALQRLAGHVPRQEAGRFSERELILSRANRSERLFGHVVERLSRGQQPEPAMLDSVGYLMRTTAVYGNGKFGIADRSAISDRAPLAGPFQAEMLTVWLIRGFTIDLVEHVSGGRLERAARRRLGVGNATGLGMAPFLVHHPALISNWASARETALATVLTQERATPEDCERMAALFERAIAHVAGWRVGDATQMARIETLARELPLAAAAFESVAASPYPWERLLERSKDWSLETQEMLVALMIDVAGDENDALTAAMGDDSAPRLDPTMTVAMLLAQIEARYGWARQADWSPDPYYFWYVSEEKLEPRLGRVGVDHGDDQATPLDIGRQVRRLATALDAAAPEEGLAAFLMRHPEHRAIVRRIQWLADYPYGEIQDDLVGAECRPIDLLRFKLAFFGASHFDPKSDRWTRITLARGAPEFEEIEAGLGGDWSPMFGAPSLEGGDRRKGVH